MSVVVDVDRDHCSSVLTVQECATAKRNESNCNFDALRTNLIVSFALDGLNEALYILNMNKNV